MKREIGSFFELNNINNDIVEQDLSQKIKELTKMEYVYLLCSGREAIGLVIEHTANLQLHKVCLLPKYTCDTVIIPFTKKGWKVYFYSINKDLSVDEEDFNEKLYKYEPSIILLHSYYGVDTIANVRKTINDYRNNTKCIVIEDMTQSIGILANMKNEIADYYICSLRKWFDIPDGSFVATNSLIELNLNEKTTFLKDKIEAQTLKSMYLKNEKVEKTIFLKLNARAENILYEDDRICAMSSISIDRMSHISLEDNLVRRKENSEYLNKNIPWSDSIRKVIDINNVSPLYYPIYSENRIKLQEWLRINDIFAPVLWPIPKEVERMLNDNEKYIFNNLLAIPCDQRYILEDMERIVNCLKEYAKHEECGNNAS